MQTYICYVNTHQCSQLSGNASSGIIINTPAFSCVRYALSLDCASKLWARSDFGMLKAIVSLVFIVLLKLASLRRVVEDQRRVFYFPRSVQYLVELVNVHQFNNIGLLNDCLLFDCNYDNFVMFLIDTWIGLSGFDQALSLLAGLNTAACRDSYKVTRCCYR